MSIQGGKTPEFGESPMEKDSSDSEASQQQSMDVEDDAKVAPQTPPFGEHQEEGHAEGDSDGQEAEGEPQSEKKGKTTNSMMGIASGDIFGEYSSSSSHRSSDDDESENRGKRRERGAEAGTEKMAHRPKNTTRTAAFSDSEDEDERVGEEEEGEEGEPRQRHEEVPTFTELQISRHRARLGQEGISFVRFPHFLGVESKPFDAETYEEEEVEEDNEEGSRQLKLKLENNIRWRYKRNEEGVQLDEPESNAKVVRWSDGSSSLYLGSQIFDIEQPKIPDNTHLFIRQGALQAQAAFHKKLTFRPYSTDALTKRRSGLGTVEKKARMKVMEELDVSNPELKKQALIQREEEKSRANARRLAQQRRVRERPRISGLSRNFLEGGGYSSEEEAEEGTSSLTKIKRQFQPGRSPPGGRRRLGDYSPSEESEVSDESRGKAKKPTDVRIVSDEEMEEGEEAEHSEERTKERKTTEIRKKRIIEDEEEGAPPAESPASSN